MIQQTEVDSQVLDKKLDDISKIARSLSNKQYNLGVLNGTSGVALFQLYYGRYKSCEEQIAFGSETIVNCVDRINLGYGYPTFCNGLAGTGWAFDHMNQEGLIELDMDSMFSPLDEYLRKKMCEDFGRKNYDYLHGAIGYGLYFLKRFKNTLSSELKEKYRGYIFDLIGFLEQSAEATGECLRWFAASASDPEEHGYNLSLSHGISSIINFLSRLYAIEGFGPRVKPLMEGGVRYMLQFQNQNENNFALFPSRISLDAELNYKSRLAWCYGDLGVGLSLWHVATVLHDASLENRALKILRHASKRRDPEQSLVMDAGICHGAFGIAQVFRKMHRKTGDPDFFDATQFWMEQGLKMSFHEEGFAGFRKFRMLNNKECWDNDLCLLEGIAGIGLVMLDHLSESASLWDECLLIS